MSKTGTERNREWQNKNPEHARYLNYRSRTRTFIGQLATMDDIIEIEKLLKLRREALATDEQGV